MQFWEYLLDFAMTDALQQQTQYRTGSQTHRAKLRLWQILLLCSPFIHTSIDLDRYVPVLMSILTAGNIANVRMLVERTVCCLLVKRPERLRDVVFPIMRDYERRHEALPACMLIAYQVRHMRTQFLNSDMSNCTQS